MRLISILILSLLTLSACGKKGELSPPPGHQQPPSAESDQG